MTKRDWKIVAATLTIVGAILSILDKIFAPSYLLLESSSKYPNALRTIGWLFLLLPSLIYIALDWGNLFPDTKYRQKTGRKNPLK